VRRLSLLFLLPATLSACAGNDVIVQRQASMEGRLEQVMQAQNSSKSEIAGLSLQIKELKDQLAKHAAAENEARERSEALQSRVKMLTNRLEQIETPARQSTTIELVNREAGAAGREDSVQAAYMKAFGLFSADNYAAAAEAFNSFIADYPESEHAANARFWLGECYFSTGRYREAVDTFAKVLDSQPSARRAAEAMLRIGLSWQKLDDQIKSKAALRTVVEKYPESEAASQARQHLNQK
jgi:tol-pal system protein YbgF